MPQIAPQNAEQSITDRKTFRLEAFSDAVLAIAMTLPLTELLLDPIPDGGPLTEAYRDTIPIYFSYVSSFVVIGVYWAHSHFSGKIYRKTDHGFNLLTLLFLVSVSVTAVPNTPFFLHIDDPDNVQLASSVYSWTLAGPSIAWLVRWLYGVRAGLLDPTLTPTYVRRATLKHAAAAVAFVVAALITQAGFWRIGMGLDALLIATYLLPPMKPLYQPGQAPEDDIQEADER